MKQSASIAAAFFAFWLCSECIPSVWAYRDYFTQEQKAQLGKIQTVLVDAIVLTDKGAGNADGIREVVMRRMGELGYAVSSRPQQPP